MRNPGLVVLGVSTYRYALPERTPGGVVGRVVLVLVAVWVTDLVVAVDVGVLYFGRYLIPVLGQVDGAPTGSTGINTPLCTEPRTL
jgi:hypothetical protein